MAERSPDNSGEQDVKKKEETSDLMIFWLETGNTKFKNFSLDLFETIYDK
jgi:hypothetical protein